LFGSYENFPETVHNIALFNYQDPAKSVQQAILHAFHHLNYEVYDLGAVTPYLKQGFQVGFEFGVAESSVFTFLDSKELDQCLKRITEKEVQTLDFFFVVRYHATSDCGKRVPLRFDYHVLRFIFQDGCLEMQIRHEKGSQRIPLDDLTGFIAKQVNSELYQKRLNSLVLVNFEKVGLQ
jgi:hypothetical protein